MTAALNADQASDLFALDNCARERIDIPGAIQPHGALLAFMPDGTLVCSSTNAIEVAGNVPAPGEVLAQGNLTTGMREAIFRKLASADDTPEFVVMDAAEGTLDMIMHRSEGLLIVEMERRLPNWPPLDEYASMAQYAINRIAQAGTVLDMLQTAVDEVRRLTGFDRVMAYQFLHDDSGEVRAEARRGDIPALLGLRFPASDIPVQARRLYVLNPIRLIADAGYVPVALAPDRNPVTGRAIDLSHSVLRSVSPVHLVYLKNMGVAASMSISIIVRGRLWGMLACHHEQPRLVPHAVRLSCVVLSRILSAIVERNETEGHARAIEDVAALRRRILVTVRDAKELPTAFADSVDELMQLVAADGCAVSVDGKLTLHGVTPQPEQLAHLVEWHMLHGADDLFCSSHASAEIAMRNAWPSPICGVLAIRFEREQKAYVLWFRNEQIESVRWAGEPVKQFEDSEFGPRLSPRASFALWQQEVHGRSVPWTDTQIDIARQLRNELQDIALSKSTRLRLDRERMWATLGHDLRVPLQAIMISAGRLSFGATDPNVTTLAGRITAASHRMGRLVSEVMDISKLQSGLGLRMDLRQLDFNALVTDMIAETRLAFPHAEIEFEPEGNGVITADADRISQVLTNLIGNAVAHGEPGRPVSLTVVRDTGMLRLVVANYAAPLSDAAMADMFSPYKSGPDSGRNKQGLGLGLHIAREIVLAHQGSITASQDDGIVSFAVELPAGV